MVIILCVNDAITIIDRYTHIRFSTRGVMDLLMIMYFDLLCYVLRVPIWSSTSLMFLTYIGAVCQLPGPLSAQLDVSKGKMCVSFLGIKVTVKDSTHHLNLKTTFKKNFVNPLHRSSLRLSTYFYADTTSTQLLCLVPATQQSRLRNLPTTASSL